MAISILPKRLWRRTQRYSSNTMEFTRLQKGRLRTTGTSISFCTVTMDRYEHLVSTFLRNVADNITYKDCDFVLLNYSCPDKRTHDWARSELLPYIASGRVNYYYYPDAKYFSHSHSKNMAFRLARGEVLCNVDADNLLGCYFAHYVSAALRQDGYYLRCGTRDGRGLAGRIAVRKTDFQNVSGYDERFQGWGGEDGDLCNRLAVTGLKKRTFYLERFCGSIRHNSDLRTAHHAQDIKTSKTFNAKLKRDNQVKRVINPNGSRFGRGRVQVNFNEWISL